VEIGPGRGGLTDLLAHRAARVVAIELDRDLTRLLRERYAGESSVEIVQQDVLTVDLAALGGPGYALVGNVPYYITTPIIFRALESPRPSRAVFLVQSEVADRIGAAPASEAYGALSVNVQVRARSERLFGVPAGAFQPAPTVDSAVIRLEPLNEPPLPPELEARFRTLVTGCFGLRRKQMRRVVRTLLDRDAPAAESMLAAARIDPEARPEVLSPADFVRLTEEVVRSERLGEHNEKRR